MRAAAGCGMGAAAGRGMGAGPCLPGCGAPSDGAARLIPTGPTGLEADASTASRASLGAAATLFSVCAGDANAGDMTSAVWGMLAGTMTGEDGITKGVELAAGGVWACCKRLTGSIFRKCRDAVGIRGVEKRGQHLQKRSTPTQARRGVG